MRALLLLLCLALAGCTTNPLSGDVAPAALSAPAANAPAAAGPAPAASPPPPGGPRDVTEAKVICWGKVEREKQRVRTIDQRITYVERCVAEQMKAN
jgi:hypothetical protein